MFRIAALFLIFCFFQISSATAQEWRAYFDEDQTSRANPERGFSRWTRSETNDLYPFEASWLNPLRNDLKQTVIMRTYYFTDAYNSPISQSFLDHITSDLQAVRAAGMKLAIRFAYTYEYANTDGQGNPIPPYLDGPSDPEIIFQHIEQLKPVLADHWDIILTMHNGFWGTWGENFYSDNFGSEANPPVTTAQWDLRKRLNDTLLNWIPEDRFLSQRYPQLKEQFYSLQVPADSITAATAYTSLPQARIGYHNDCFLVADNDYTYTDTTTQKPFVASESAYTIMGGETCGNSSFAVCPNALEELERFHWTYMNDNYHPDVLNRWEQEGCYAEIENRLGYRIVIDSLVWDSGAQPGEPYSLDLYMRNLGFAAPVHNRPIEIILIDGSGAEYLLSSSFDMRDWRPGPINVSVSGAIPSTFPSLTPYELVLSMPDPNSSLKDDPRYAVALSSAYNFANLRIFEEASGYNYLVSVSISNNFEQLLKVISLPQNPIRDRLIIESSVPDELEVSLASLSGQILLKDSFRSDGNWSVAHLPTGMYLLHLRNSQGQHASYKVLKIR